MTGGGGRDDGTIRQVAVERPELGMQMKGQAAPLAPALQLEHAITLTRRMPLGERQATGLGEDLGERHRPVVHRHAVAAHDLHERRMADVGPRREQRKIIFDLGHEGSLTSDKLASALEAMPARLECGARRTSRIARFISHISCLTPRCELLTGGYHLSMVRAALGVAEIQEFPALAGVAMVDSRDQDPGSRSTDEAALSARLRRLGERLDRIGTRRAKDAGAAPGPRADS